VGIEALLAFIANIIRAWRTRANTVRKDHPRETLIQSTQPITIDSETYLTCLAFIRNIEDTILAISNLAVIF
jgi:hypothetical protein